MLFCLIFVFAIFDMSSLDGIHTKSNLIKRLPYIFAILILIWYYLQMYFDIMSNSDEFVQNVNKSITLGNNYDYYWRDIALSSLSKTIIFVCTQLYKNFKRPNHVNVYHYLL